MSGYAASARLQGGSPRFVPIGRSGSDDPSVALAPDGGAPFEAPDRVRIDLVGWALGDRLTARLDDLRETWSQTTFFLFDPESWR